MSKEEKEEKTHEEELENQTEQEQETAQETESEEQTSATDEKDEEIEELKKKLDAQQEKYVKVYADFENSKKRLQKDKDNAVAYANESFAKDLLPVIDSLDMALKAAQNSGDDKMVEGIELTIEQFKKAISKHGVEIVDVDNGFDPQLHNAVMQVESEEHEEGAIVEVMQHGYQMKDRLLRPSMVSIAK
ncbi:MAG: nucleotide exchange factor GrpE [Campylobacterota bacterium]